ncbi:MAG: hypothetical protein ABJB86_01190 [Bacteroidota bacterium]
MLFSKWIVADLKDYQELNKLPVRPGLCVEFLYDEDSMPGMYQHVQEIIDPNGFTILLSDNSISEMNTDTVLNSIITLFFQPSFYIVNKAPVIFTTATVNIHFNEMLKKLKEKCLLQGFADVIIVQPINNTDSQHACFYYIDGRNFNLNSILENPINDYLKSRNFFPPHFVIFGDTISNKLVQYETILNQELLASKTVNYKIATEIYYLQMKIQHFGHKLSQQNINEDNLRIYLEIQKKDLSKALDWYHYEYEILPIWYKQFGHIVKVIMGKRSFRSLFSDNVKKYKD